MIGAGREHRQSANFEPPSVTLAAEDPSRRAAEARIAVKRMDRRIGASIAERHASTAVLALSRMHSDGCGTLRQEPGLH